MKYRTNYVSNSSSSSFILDNEFLIERFNSLGINIKCYSIKLMKSKIREFLRYFIEHFGEEFNVNDIEAKFNGYFPKYM